MRKLYNKCYTYYNSFRKFPDDLKDLKNIGISKEDYLDAWGNEIRLVNRRGYIDLVSAGRDSKFGTEDDIVFQDVRVVRVAVQDTGPIMNLKKAENQISGRSESFPSKDDFLVRQYFPETFYSSLIQVDKNKKISLVLPDSITNWKAKFFAVSSNGKIGSKTLDITVFQEFFIDINNPLFLTQGDEISLPIVVYNYTKEDLKVKVKIEKEDWFDLLDEEVKSVIVKPNSPGNLYFRIKAKKAGINNLTVLAYGNRFKDAIKKDIEVLPNGFAVFNNNSAYVEKTGNFNFVIPSYAINDSYKVYLYLYPGFSSQVLGGLDKLLTVPYGCFEQTSSINYPNILILRYLRQKNISNPAIEMKAEYYLNIGYQRLLTFEVEGGGFSWFGDKPANKVLTAFGLMEFKDMKDVFFVDEKLIERTKQFLMSNQESDGGWQPDSNYLHAESWGKIQKQRITVTSYILMALLDNDKKIYDQYGEKIKKSLNLLYQNLKNNINEIDNYTLGLMLNVFADARDYERFSNEAIGLIINELEKRAKSRGEEIYWEGTKTLFYGDDLASDIETTSLIGLAMIKLNKFDLALKIVKFLINSKDNRGIWYSTQPTILALKTIINFEEKSNTFSSQPKKVKISINGNENVVNFDKNDLAYKIIDLTSYVRKGENTLRIETDGSILFDLNYNFYLPFDRYVKKVDILDINIRYDRSELSINDKVKVFVEVKNNTNEVLEMVVLDLGVPPGFSVDLSNLKNNPKVKNVENTNRQVIVYFDKIDKNEKINLEYEMISKYPLKVKVLPSKAYEYYNPSKVVISEGKVLEVK
ncbi:MAG: alpha-2-macroglobulin family protein, partial [bacterium]